MAAHFSVGRGAGGGMAGAAAAAARKSIHQMPESAFRLTQNELESITEVFKQYEIDHNEATMHHKDLAEAMKKLGLNPTETEIQDLINEVEVEGYIYYQDFCKIVVRKMREEDEENFYQELFRTLVGPNPPPTTGAGHGPSAAAAAAPYNVTRQRLSLEQFSMVMANLPLGAAGGSGAPSEQEVRDMFAVADRDGNGRISYNEFRRMCVVPKLETIPDAPAGAKVPGWQRPHNGGSSNDDLDSANIIGHPGRGASNV